MVDEEVYQKDGYPSDVVFIEYTLYPFMAPILNVDGDNPRRVFIPPFKISDVESIDDDMKLVVDCARNEESDKDCGDMIYVHVIKVREYPDLIGFLATRESMSFCKKHYEHVKST